MVDTLLNDNYMATPGVRTFLEDLGLVQYYDIFVIKGFDSEDDICNLNHDDLDSMMISDTDHRRQILGAARCYSPTDQYRVCEWLRQNGLDHYYINFVQSDLTTLDSILRLNLPDADIYDELEITLPGHIRRLERAVYRLRKRRKTEHESPEVPLAYGRWSKPDCLQDAKFDFLVIDATVCSTKDPRTSHQIEFMVDSGSDVTTIREEVLQGLNLELLGRIHSKGVHGSKTTNLYKAILRIGNQELQIEVMGESYDSLGSRVVRHFKHYIDHERHVWMRSDYCDPTMIVSPPIDSGSHQSENAPNPTFRKSSSSSSTAYPSSSTSYRSLTESQTTSSSQNTQRSSADLSQSTQQSLSQFESYPADDSQSLSQIADDTQSLSQIADDTQPLSQIADDLGTELHQASQTDDEDDS